MRRRDFTMGLLLAATTQSVRAQERTKQHRIAIVVPQVPSLGSVAAGGSLFYQAIFEELRKLGDIEGQTLTVERYSGEGRPESFADLAREVVSRNPDVIVAVTETIARDDTARIAELASLAIIATEA